MAEVTQHDQTRTAVNGRPVDHNGLGLLDHNDLGPVDHNGLGPLDHNGLGPVDHNGLGPLDHNGLGPVDHNGLWPGHGTTIAASVGAWSHGTISPGAAWRRCSGKHSLGLGGQPAANNIQNLRHWFSE